MLSYKGSSAAQKFTLRIGFAFALSASVTGCAVGPKYQRPTVNAAAVSQCPVDRNSYRVAAGTAPRPVVDGLP